MNEAPEKSVGHATLHLFFFLVLFFFFYLLGKLNWGLPAQSLMLPPSGKQPAFTWGFSQRERCSLPPGFAIPQLSQAGVHLGCSAKPVEGRGLSPVLRWPLFLPQ